MANQLTRILGIGAALAVPAIAVGALTIPKTFQGGQQLSAADLNENFVAIRTEFAAQQATISDLQANVSTLQDKVETLEDTVAELEDRQPGTELVALTRAPDPEDPNDLGLEILTDTPTRVWLSHAPGILVTLAGGSNWEHLETRIYLADTAATCPDTDGDTENACTTAGRAANGGDNLTIPVPADTYFTVLGGFPDNTGKVLVYFFPLTSGGLPTLVN